MMPDPGSAQGATPPTICVACSIFRREIEHLRQTGRLRVEPRYLNSMLHLEPRRLEQRLEDALSQEHSLGHGVVLAFGDCCAHMNEFERQKALGRTQGINCCEILLGTDRYRRLRREGAFFLLPEWACSWRAMLQERFGFEGDNARSFMREMHTRITYLDTGLAPVPRKHLAELAQFTGLPVEVLPVGLEHLLSSLESVLGEQPPHE